MDVVGVKSDGKSKNELMHKNPVRSRTNVQQAELFFHNARSQVLACTPSFMKAKTKLGGITSASIIFMITSSAPDAFDKYSACLKALSDISEPS
jgi:hypothetical protein